MTPFPIIISAPSGAGKTTLTRALLERRPDIGYSVSATTRAPRPGEQDGVAYHFLDEGSFEAAVAAGEFAEHASVHGNRYGTLRREVDRVLASGRHVVMDIDVQGAAQFVLAYPAAVRIFVLPPSGVTLLARLRGRGTEDDTTIATRMRDALTELAVLPNFQYVVVNDDLTRALAQISCIVDAEALRVAHAPQSVALAASIAAEVAAELDTLSPEITHASSHP